MNGKTHWLWCFANDDLSDFLIDRSRGHPLRLRDEQRRIHRGSGRLLARLHFGQLIETLNSFIFDDAKRTLDLRIAFRKSDQSLGGGLLKSTSGRLRDVGQLAIIAA